MLTRFHRFNIYLLAVGCLTLLAGAGCQSTPEEKAERAKSKERCAIRLHIESPTAADGFSMQVPVFRASPLLVSVTKDPVLYERDVAHASVVDQRGSFAIKIEFNEHGKLVLDSLTTANRGRRIVLQAVWTEMRWLGAPIITQRISEGVLLFTPDATREEAERIARGLNNMVKIFKKEENFLLF